jgi:hypothetical protein
MNLNTTFGLFGLMFPLEFDSIMYSVFTHVYSIPILMIAMNYTKNNALPILQILCLLTGTWMFVDNINIIKSRAGYSKRDDFSVYILLGIIMIPEIGTMSMFGSITDIMTIVVVNMLLVILNAMFDSRRENMLQFWYEMSSIKSFSVSLMSLYLIIKNPAGNLPMPLL